MKKASIGQTLFGLLVLVLGVGFMLDALDIADFGSIIGMWWPLAIITVGVASFISNPRVILWPVVIVAIGALLLVQQFGWLNFNVWQLVWPSLVILFGLSLLFNLGRPKPRDSKDDELDVFVAFSGNQARNVAQNFKGGRLTAVFGGIELDLTDAHIKGKADIDMFAAFGGIDIRVPEGWTVNVNGLPLFGGWEDKTRRPKDQKAVLNIQGTCLFGGVSIKN